MINAEQLRELGWSDELIAEVKRAADEIAPIDIDQAIAGSGFRSTAAANYVLAPDAVATSASAAFRFE